MQRFHRTISTLNWNDEFPPRIQRRKRHDRARDGAGAHGGRHRYRIPPLHPQSGRLRADHDRVHQLARRERVAWARAKPTKTLQRYLAFEPEEHPISAQLFGADPAVMADAARVCQDLGFDILDINFGCPVNKVVKCNGGSGLLRDLPLVERLLREVRAAITIPFTMKFRAGWNDQELVTVQMAQLAEDCGLQAIALHPARASRATAARRTGRRIAEVKAAVKIPVIGNGDIVTPEDAVRMVRETGCDAVMIGRAASSQSVDFPPDRAVSGDRRYDEPTHEDRYEMMRTYYAMLMERARRRCASAR